MTSAADVAAWMKSALYVDTVLYQDVAVGEISSRFGDGFIKINANGNLAITPAVLKAFNAITGDEVVWMRSERLWRKRLPYDMPGRQQP